ncbi:SLU7 [Symbiodinium natans]|uniref:Pre-mRNA-splicing factor SLU7 n=1 Tax=Symbiodinium natans TaxID=878477 RepID=A0A812R8L4_9DINO|nr:SLU7 [Symbiodinium natans]
MADGQHLASSRYTEDAFPSGHRSIWGSWYDSDSGAWGYACCKATNKSAAPCAAIESDASEVARQTQAAAETSDQPEIDLIWRSRSDFETAEGFIIHSSKYLATQWLRWLQDGKLSEVASKFDPDVRKVLLSEPAAKEACQQVQRFCQRLDDRVPVELSQPLEDFCSCIGTREYVKANKAYMDIVMGSRKWQGDVPYLVEGNRNGPSVVQNVAERLNKKNSNPLDEAGIRDHAVVLRRLLKVAQAVLPNDDPSKNCG